MTDKPIPHDRMLQKSEVCEIVGLSSQSIWRRIKRGEFPRARRYGPQCIRWHESEVRDWIKQQPRQGCASTRQRPKRRHKRVLEDCKPSLDGDCSYHG